MGIMWTTLRTTVERGLINSDKGTMLGSSWKLIGGAEHLMDGSEKVISRLSFQFYRPYAIENRMRSIVAKD